MDWYDYHDTREQVICDDCGAVQLRGLAYRSDFETPVRLCRKCVAAHDTNKSVTRERDHHEAMLSDGEV